MELLQIMIITLIQGIVFALFGIWILSFTEWADRHRKMKTSQAECCYSVSEAYVIGFSAAFCIFEVYTLLCIFLDIPTHVVGYIVGTTGLAAAAAGICCLRYKMCVKDHGLKTVFKSHGLFLLIPIVLVIFFCLRQFLYKESSVDAMHYINLSSTAVYYDRMAQYNPYTGAKLNRFLARYVFNTFPYYSSAVSSLTGVNTAIIARTVLPVLSVMASILTYYRIGCELFRGKGKKYADIFLLFAMLVLFRGSSEYLPGSFFLKRFYEGKSMIANITAPLIMLCGIEFWNGKSCLRTGLQLFLCCGAAVCFAGSCVICMAGVPAVVLPIVIRDRAPRKLLVILCGVIPVICWGLCYYLASKGVIPLGIHRR